MNTRFGSQEDAPSPQITCAQARDAPLLLISRMVSTPAGVVDGAYSPSIPRKVGDPST